MQREERQKEVVMYMGRHVPKDNFRAYVFGFDDAKRLVNSWSEFIDACSSGNWFQSQEEVPEKPKPRKKAEE